MPALALEGLADHLLALFPERKSSGTMIKQAIHSLVEWAIASGDIREDLIAGWRPTA